MGHGQEREMVQLRLIYDKLEPFVTDALIGFHCFTRCDSTARISGKGKITCWKSFCKSNSNIVNGFCDLGEFDEPYQETVQSLYTRVRLSILYVPGTTLTDSGKVMWTLF